MSNYVPSYPSSDTQARPPARFFYQAEINDAKSLEAGRPVYEDNPFIEIWTPGDATNIIRRPVRANDMADYPQLWAAFKTQREQKPTGTPLEELPFLSEGQRLEFRAVRIQTAEELAVLPDTVGQQFAGIHSIKRKVQAYLDAAAGNAPMLKMQAELEQRDATLAAQAAQLKELAETVSNLQRAQHKKG